MSEQKTVHENAGATPADSPKFRDMSGSQKAVHLLKLVVFLATFGFAFPNVIEGFLSVEDFLSPIPT